MRPSSYCTIAQSQRGMEYEVANAQTIPRLGERRLEIWTEGATAPRGMVLQVADVHKQLLSLSRCADLGYESRLGKACGYLLGHETGESIHWPAMAIYTHSKCGCELRGQSMNDCARHMILPGILPGRDRE